MEQSSAVLRLHITKGSPCTEDPAWLLFNLTLNGSA